MILKINFIIVCIVHINGFLFQKDGKWFIWQGFFHKICRIGFIIKSKILCQFKKCKYALWQKAPKKRTVFPACSWGHVNRPDEVICDSGYTRSCVQNQPIQFLNILALIKFANNFTSKCDTQQWNKQFEEICPKSAEEWSSCTTGSGGGVWCDSSEWAESRNLPNLPAAHHYSARRGCWIFCPCPLSTVGQ